MSKRDTWYKLDLSANVYPTLQRKDFSSVYRVSVTLKELIQPDILQQAVDMTLPRFPTFKTALRRGLFWRYLEPNNRPGPFVKPDIVNPCMPMNFRSDNRHLIRVYYYQKKNFSGSFSFHFRWKRSFIPDPYNYRSLSASSRARYSGRYGSFKYR